LFSLYFRLGLTTGVPVFQRIAAPMHRFFRSSDMVVVRLNLHLSTFLPMMAFTPPHLSLTEMNSKWLIGLFASRTINDPSLQKNPLTER
jgi:hypothetical protein